jgi:hypothetical protein
MWKSSTTSPADPSPHLRHADRHDGHQPERADRLFQPRRKLAGLVIDKGARFTDWSRRPLTERQIEYAIGDVTHLAKIFPKILKRLIKTGRGEWLNAEMEKLADPDNYRNDGQRLVAHQGGGAQSGHAGAAEGDCRLARI